MFRAASGGWREYWLGWPTALTIVANTVLPGYLDRFLARNAIAGQQTRQPLLGARRDNLNAPITALHRAHGSFDDEAGGTAPLIPAEIGRLGVVALGALAFFALGALTSKVYRPRSSAP